MNILRDITRILYQYGDLDNRHLIALSQVWIHYDKCDMNVYIKDGKAFILCDGGYEYPITKLTQCEQFSILSSLEDYVNECEKLMNKEFEDELNE